MVLLSCGLLYAATGLMHDGLYITDVIMAIVSASLAAASKVSLSLAYEHVSLCMHLFCLVTLCLFMHLISLSFGKVTRVWICSCHVCFALCEKANATVTQESTDHR